MHRFRTIGTLLLVALAFTGCKTNAPLAQSEARRQIEAALFAGPAATQTVAFESGHVEEHPYAVAQFLFAKHWTACATETGALETTPTCTLDDEGVTYGRAHRWTVAATPDASCEKCATWTIPVAVAKLETVQSIDVLDKTHANVAYTYVVTPNEFGASLGEWVAGHALSWCGPNAAAVGGWSATRVGHAAFVKDAGAWTLQNAAGATFADTFAVPGDPGAKVCAGS